MNTIQMIRCDEAFENRLKHLSKLRRSGITLCVEPEDSLYERLHNWGPAGITTGIKTYSSHKLIDEIV